ncbi:putative disease resistance protein RGA3 [Cannabis sativa]|uniref:putative disease resistance protein RGA3 n=1 Tax=Cannabis sativa TaxID=3483 RepID=UPI0029C9D687|nr:putative disease resistance protein RGA3 [Cannabis sativa]
MAEAVLTVVLENLSLLIQKQVGSILGVEKEMEKMCSMLSTISAVIEDAEERQSTNRAIKNWLQKLEDVSSELEDVLDDCEAEAFRMDQSHLQYDHHKWIRKVQSSLSCLSPKHLYFRHNIAKKIKEIEDRLDQIANERVHFHLREVDVGERRNQIRESRQTGSVITQPHVYGREEDKERVVGFLVNDAINCSDTSVYCIVGLGGMGKTTLAQWVFNDERLNEHFELKIWVCVFEDFDVRKLIKAIIESGNGRPCEAMEMDPLQRQLQNMLQRKRFLIVLDDVWNEDHEEWDKLKYVLECGSKGASVVVTTRSKKVAFIMGTTPTHHYLTGLSDDDCWLLFKQRAFGNHREERPNLVNIGKEIVKKCKGVPLAAKALGGLMCFKSGEEEVWLSVMRSELWNLPEDKASILPALKLSYLHLPVEQRRCFSYCAIFPKDHKIIKTMLIHLWMANGLISSKPELELEVEDVGNEMINDLCWRSFLDEGTVMGFDGSIYYFKMHDLFHDLAQSIMGDKCRSVEVNDDTHTINLSERVRHLTCTFSGLGSFSNIPSTKSLRTIMTLSNDSTACDNYWNFCSLRAFDRSYVVIHKASISSLVSNLKHVRYLNLSHISIEVLPDSICLLHHLLTLNLSFCYELRKLPKHMIRLKGLRHLYIIFCDKLSHLPPNIGKLSCLKTLTNFIVDKKKGCQLDELKDLNIGGVLHIRNLENVIMNPIEARFANLSAKRSLEGLYLCWNNNEEESEENAKEVLEALAPPASLKWLEIHYYKGAHFSSWFRDDILGSVVRITLSYCHNCRELLHFGKLTSLRYLEVSRMKLVQFIHSHGDLRSSFGCLESLEIVNLPNLEGFSRHEVGNEMFPCLSSLEVTICPKLSLPKLGSVKSLRVDDGRQVLLESISNLYGLTQLHMEHCHLTSLPQNMLHNLNSLQFLEIRSCPELTCLPEGMFRDCSLQRICIADCEKLRSLSESFQNLTMLNHLELDNCPAIEEGFPSGPNQLISLQHLYIGGSYDASQRLPVLPESLQHLSSLEHLKISMFSELASLPDWLGNLTTLKELNIICCPDMECIPMSMQRLTNLKTLYIHKCPKLEQRCEKEVGEDWHNISHIPDVRVLR